MKEQPGERKFKAAHWAVKEVDHVLSRLAGYTRFVFYSKWFLMVLALGLLITLIGLPLLSKDRSGIRVSFVDAQVTQAPSNAKPVMNSPAFYGTTDKGDQYKVNGQSAIQQTASVIDIMGVEAQLIAKNGGWRSLSADAARYFQAEKKILLKGSVTVLDAQGYNFTTPSAEINITASEVVGSEHIEGGGPLGNLLASSFKIMNNGQRLIFYRGEKPVRVVIHRANRGQ